MLAIPLHILQRHPLTVSAHFNHSLVLTYAFPAAVLEPLLPPGLLLDTQAGCGFVAIAMVQTRGLRPAILPRALGQSFFLAGYRIFTTFRPPGGANTLRGLFILRSDTDRRLMAFAGNLLTHYKYRVSRVHVSHEQDTLTCRIGTRRHAADLDVTADLAGPAALPPTSPFDTEHQARRFAGPLPYTFDHEPETNSIIAIKATRQNWHPRLVPVTVRELSFFHFPPFNRAVPRLASAFHVHDIDYQWNPGIRYRLM
jgi:hypothetical protein